MEEILTAVLNIQKLVYKGFHAEENTSTEWLNVRQIRFLINISTLIFLFLKEVCREFFTLFKVLQKFLIFEVSDGSEKPGILQNYFLCFSQIVACIKNLEKTIFKEIELKTTLKVNLL